MGKCVCVCVCVEGGVKGVGRLIPSPHHLSYLQHKRQSGMFCVVSTLVH